MKFPAALLLLCVTWAPASALAQAPPAEPASPPAAATPLAPEPAVAAAVKSQFLAWQAGKIDHAAYNDDANKELTPAILAQVSKQLQPLGAPTKLTLLDRKVKGSVRYYAFAVDTTKGRVQVLYALDGAGKIAGIRFSPGGEEPQITALARSQFEALRAGHIDATLYTQDVAAGMTPAVLARVQGFLTPLGTVNGLTFFGKSHSGNFDVYVYKVDCERGSARETLSLDSAGKIGGIFVAPWDS